MKCPFCGKEMESGFVSSGATIMWKIKRKRIPINPFLSEKKGEFVFAHNPFGGAAAAGTLCRSCNKIVLDLSQSDWPWEL